MIKPLNDNVFLEPIHIEKESLLIIVENENTPPSTGLVKYAQDESIIGETVMFPPYGFKKVLTPEGEYFVIKRDSILGCYSD